MNENQGVDLLKGCQSQTTTTCMHVIGAELPARQTRKTDFPIPKTIVVMNSNFGPDS